MWQTQSLIPLLTTFIPTADYGYYSDNDSISVGNSLPGPQGESGYSGYSGATGLSGYSGATGLSGYSGISGYSGYSGATGATGAQGDPGPVGPPGPSGSSLMNVKQVSYDYMPTASDTYIGCNAKNIVITLPPGVVGKLYIVKNQSVDGNVKVVGSNGELLDDTPSKTLGNNGMLLALFVNPRWSLI